MLTVKTSQNQYYLLATLLLYATPTPHWLFLTIAISPAQLVPWLLGSLDESSGASGDGSLS